MQEQLSQPAQGAKILACDLARAKQQREASAPEYLKVLRCELTHPQLNATCALVLAAIRWLASGDKLISNRLIASWLGVNESTVYRARQRIAAVTELYPNTDGYLEVHLDLVRKHGTLEACAHAQLKGWCNPEHGSAQFRGRNFLVPARVLAQRIGCCPKTALAVLQRLAEAELIEVRWCAGFAGGVRLLGERQRAPADPPPLLPAALPPALQKPIRAREMTESAKRLAEQFGAPVAAPA